MESTKGFLRNGFKEMLETIQKAFNYKIRIGVMTDACKNKELLIVR